MRIAVVVTEVTPERLAAARQRLDQARSRGEALLVAPPQVALALGETGHWADPSACDRATVGTRPGPAPLVFEALRSLGSTLDEARFEAASAAGQVACAEARTGGARVAARLVVELAPGDASLSRGVALGDRIEDRLHLAAARMALRDADAVEEEPGAGDARAALLGAGWTLAAQQQALAWSPEQAPAVSAVITFHNLGRYLPACLASLRAQTVPCELVVVDDGSRPEEAALLDAEAARDPALRLVRQANQGLPAARNAGIKAASHPLVLIVDADNVLRPRMVERLRDALRLRPDAAWANPAFRSFRDGTDETVFVYGPAEQPGELLLLRNVVGDACALHRREPLERLGFRLPHPHFIEDWDLWLRAAEAGLGGAAVPEVLFDYRERADSLLRTPPPIQHRLSNLRILQEHAGLLAALTGPAFVVLAGEQEAEAGHNQELGRRQREPELVEARAQAARLERGQAELRERAAGLEREREEHRGRAVLLDAGLSAANARVAQLEEGSAALRAQAASLTGEVARLQAALHEVAEARRSLEESRLVALQRATAAELGLAAERTAQAKLQAELQVLQRGLDEVMSSRAVKAAQALRAASPGLHRRTAQLAGLLADLLNGRER